MVGTLVSMVHATNVPVLFVGVGQHYSDLRNLSVKWAVEKLLSSKSTARSTQVLSGEVPRSD
jgi:signal recognition particle receptor subunit alpha